MARHGEPGSAGGHRLFLLVPVLVPMLMALAGSAHAHGEADDALPPEPGVRLSAAIAATQLESNQALPSQRLRGFLLQGDAGTDRRGLGLEHGTVGADWRINGGLGAELVLGKHGSDAAHVESAWVQWRRDADDGQHWWLWSAGRQQPALGAAMGQAGHLDSFGLMPLAKQMALNGDWIDDGLQLGWRQDDTRGRFSADVGLWRGRVFPGGEGASPVPSAHLGWAQRPWALDAWVATFGPERRGSLVSSVSGHSHASPVCTPNLSAVVCMAGRSTVAGASAVWQGARSGVSWPLTVTASGWLRQEHGSLESANGLGRYSAQNQGGWVQGVWDWSALNTRWQTGFRLERVGATQSLTGAGATLVAADAGLSAYQPATRQAAMVAWLPRPNLRFSLEVGRERGGDAAAASGVASVRFAMLRLVAQTDWLSGSR